MKHRLLGISRMIMNSITSPDNYGSLSDRSEFNLAGCLLVDTAVTVKAIQSILAADDFQNENCKAIFSAAMHLVNSGELYDPVIIQKKAEDLGFQLDNDFSIRVKAEFVTAANAAEHAKIVHEAALKRRIDAACIERINNDISTLELIGKLQALDRQNKPGIKTPLELANEFADYFFSDDTISPFLSTGYYSLDRILSGGFVSGGLYTLAGRTGMGKTNVALNIAGNVAFSEKVLYFSLEMSSKEISARRLAILSGLNSASLQARKFRGDIQKEQRLMAAIQRTSNEKLSVYDKPATVEDIEREIRSVEGLRLAVIDNMGNITKENGRVTQYEFITGISHRLKQIALSTEIPILALAQINRATEGKRTKKPELSDLRDSGAIEEDSDADILLYRPAYYAPKDEQPEPYQAQDLDFIVAKNRHGITGVTTMDFWPYNSRIREKLKPTKRENPEADFENTN